MFFQKTLTKYLFDLLLYCVFSVLQDILTTGKKVEYLLTQSLIILVILAVVIIIKDTLLPDSL